MFYHSFSLNHEIELNKKKITLINTNSPVNMQKGKERNADIIYHKIIYMNKLMETIIYE